MKYLELVEQLVKNSTIYQEFLKKMPAPFNNPYFDTVVLILLVLYLLYRILDMIRVKRYRAKNRKLQRLEHQRVAQRNEVLENRERVLSEREERIGRFMDYVGFIFWSRTRREPTKEARQTYTNAYSQPNGLQQNEYLLEDSGNPDEISEYDLVLDEMSKKDIKQATILKNQEASRRKAEQRMLDLETENQMEKVMREEPIVPKKRRWKKVSKDEKKRG